MKRNVVVIGGGPAGLMAAEAVSGRGHQVQLYESMPTVGRKFLLAGKGGLNLTHSEAMEPFLSRYGSRREQVAPWIEAWGPAQLREWAAGLGVQTFVGTSGRVFPREMKASPLLRAWLHRLRDAGVQINVRHRWLGGELGPSPARLRFATPEGVLVVESQVVILALGGASWPRLGSDGAWVPMLREGGLNVAPLRPSNCGFEVDWSDHLRQRYAGHPLKSVVATFASRSQRGEFVITAHGIEGSLIYALSAELRDQIERQGSALLLLDLAPDLDPPRLLRELSKPRGSRTMAHHLRSRAGIEGVKAGLLREVLNASQFTDLSLLAATIKALPLRLRATRPLQEAISSAGGVTFPELDEHLMVRSWPGVFCAGEMLDWEAPTGGYLLTACLASGRWAGLGAAAWQESLNSVKK